MESKSAAKVGLAALVGIALFIAFWAFLTHLSWGKYTVAAVFDDTRGLVVQTPVLMNGKPVGEVTKIDLRRSDLKPVVTLAIRDEYPIPSNAHIRITSGILIANPQIHIYWDTAPQRPFISGGSRVWPAELVDKAPTSMLAQMSPEANAAIGQVTQSLSKLTPKLVDTLTNVQGILQRTDRMMGNFEAASVSARSLVGDPKIRQSLQTSLANMTAVSAELQQTSKTVGDELQSMVKRNGGKLDDVLSRSLDLLNNLKDTMDTARAMVTRLSEQMNDPRLQQSLQETLDLAKATMARFSQIASDIHQLTGDTDVQTNLKATVQSMKDASEKGQEIAQKVGTLVDRLSLPSVRRPLGIGDPQFAIDFLARDDAPHFRSDVGLRLPIGKQNAINLGIYDFANRDKLVAQYETPVGGIGRVRYGIYASKLGVGLDFQPSSGTRFVLDWHDPNQLQFDARALFNVSSDFSVWMGADSMFRRTTPLIGVRLKR